MSEIDKLGLADAESLVAATEALAIAAENASLQDDDMGIFAIRELTNVTKEAYKNPREELPMAGGKVLPYESIGGSEWDRQLEIPIYDTYGTASVIHDESDGGVEVGYIVQRSLYNIATIAAKTTYGWATLQAAQSKGKPLERYKLEALQDAIDRYVQVGGYFGDVDYGLLGLLNSGLPLYTSPTTFAAAPTPEALLSLVTTPVNVVEARSSTIRPKTLVLPKQQFFQLNSTYRSGTDKTILQAFLDAQKAVGGVNKVIMDNSLATAGAGGSAVMLVLPDDERAMSLVMPMYTKILPPQMVNMQAVVHAVARTALAVVKLPTTGLIIEGI